MGALTSTTGRGCLLGCVVIALCVSATRLPAATTTSNTAAVTLCVEPYLALVLLHSHIVMDDITAADIANPNEVRTDGMAVFSVYTNGLARVSVPKSITLEDNGSYEIDVDLDLSGGDGEGESEEEGNGGDATVYILLDPGSYEHSLNVEVEKQKVWTSADKADTYYGAIPITLAME